MKSRFKCGLLIALSQCLSACVGAIHADDPLWKIPIVAHGDCGAIEGRFRGKGQLYQSFIDFSTGPSMEKFSRVQGLKKIPESPLTPDELKGLNAVSDRQISTAQRRNSERQQQKFYESAATQIKKSADGFEVSLFGEDETLYAKILISTRHRRVGCDTEGRLVLREFSINQGGEGVRGSAWARETTFSLIKTGALEVHRLSRDWTATMERPPNDETEQVLIFPHAPNQIIREN